MKVLLTIGVSIILGIGVYMTLADVVAVETVQPRGAGPTTVTYNGPVFIVIGLLVLLGGWVVIRDRDEGQSLDDD